jgi:hypothetical protein
MASTITAGTTSGTALNLAGDTSGILTVQGVPIGSTTGLGAGNASIMKNRIINGAMVISQRGTSFTQDTTVQYTLDRWNIFGTVTSKCTVAQSSTAPAGFNNSLLVTSSSAYSVATGDRYMLQQLIEGFNFADLNWGTANAKTITLSFWVQSSLTGTFGGALKNDASDRSYPFTYTISAANTWTQASVTIAGDTTGTWVGSTNGIGLRVSFGLGAGSTYSGTAGSWQAANYQTATGAVSVVGTNGATFYITGVQLEVGSSATGFEYVNYQTSLANCQRYYYKTISDSSYAQVGTAFLSASTAGTATFPFPVPMRVIATSIDWTGLATCQYASAPAIAWTSSSLSGQQTKNLGNVNFSTGSSAGGTGLAVQIIANNNSNAFIGFSAEL